MKIKPFIFTVIFLLSFCKATAGWYICYTFEGKIDNHPIHLNIQIENAWGEKKEIESVDGIYFYDRDCEPINLKGTLTNGTFLSLKEFSNNVPSGEFQFSLAEQAPTGIWKNLKTNESLLLSLVKTGHLYDDEYGNIPHPVNNFQMNSVQIIQSASLPDFYFIGIYSKIESESRAQMDELRIISKVNNKVYQVVDLSNLEIKAGNLKTIIFDNLEVENIKTNELLLWVNAGRMGGYVFLKYNKKAKKFILNSRINVEGGDPGDPE